MALRGATPRPRSRRYVLRRLRLLGQDDRCAVARPQHCERARCVWDVRMPPRARASSRLRAGFTRDMRSVSKRLARGMGIFARRPRRSASPRDVSTRVSRLGRRGRRLRARARRVRLRDRRRPPRRRSDARRERSRRSAALIVSPRTGKSERTGVLPQMLVHGRKPKEGEAKGALALAFEAAPRSGMRSPERVRARSLEERTDAAH